jgi:hypothetical protein
MFVKLNKILRDDFCRAVHIFVTMDELEECFKSINFSITNDEIYNIYKDHSAHKTGYLPMEDFYAKLKIWKDYNDKRDAELREIRDDANRVVEKGSKGFDTLQTRGAS